MNLYRDFDYESNSDSEGERDKTTQLKHKSKNTFVFESFHTKLSKLKLRLNENINNDFSYTQNQNEKFYKENEKNDNLNISENFSNFKSMLEREKSLNNSVEYNKFYNELLPYTISFVYLVNNYKKIFEILKKKIGEEIEESRPSEDFVKGKWNEKQMKKINTHLIISILDLMIALIKDLRGECFEYFLDNNLQQIISLLQKEEENLEIIDKIFVFFVNFVKFLENGIKKNFQKFFVIFSEILFHKNKFIRKFGAQSLCYIMKNLEQNDLVSAVEFALNFMLNPSIIFEESGENQEKPVFLSKTKNLCFLKISPKSSTKMFICESISELLMEVLSNQKTLSIKSDLILLKLSTMENKEKFEFVLIILSTFIKLIKKVKDKDKINTIALFHTFLLSNVLNVTNANYQKIKLQKLTKQIEMFDTKNTLINTYLILFARELLSKNFKETNTIYAEYANSILDKLMINKALNELTEIDIFACIDIICLIMKFHPNILTINNADFFNMLNKSAYVEYFLETIQDLNIFSIYQSFSIFSPKYANNVDNDEYAMFSYNKDNLYHNFDILINDVECVDYNQIANIASTYDKVLNDDEDKQRLMITNETKVKNVTEHIKSNIKKNTVSNMNVNTYANVYSMLMVIDMLDVKDKGSEFNEVIEDIISHSCEEIAKYSKDNNDIKLQLTHVLLNEFYSGTKFYMDKRQGYLSLILKCVSILNNKSRTNSLISKLKNEYCNCASYGMYYFLTAGSDNTQIDIDDTNFLLLLSNNSKYKKSFLLQYKKQFMAKYKQEEENNNLSTLINEIFNSMESVYDTVFDYQNDKKYSLNIEIIISKMELLLSSGMTKYKLNLSMFVIYFLIGCYWITLTKSVWEILSRGLDRLFNYIANSAKTASFSQYESIMCDKVINVINKIFSFIQDYPSESDYVSKSNINNEKDYIIFTSKEDKDIDLTVRNVASLLSTQNANEFRTISTFFNGVTKGLSLSYFNILNSNDSFKHTYLSSFIALCKLFNHEIDLYPKSNRNKYPKEMCLLYNFILDKETKTHTVLLKLLENLFTLTSKLNALTSYNDIPNLLQCIYSMIITSRSTTIQKSAVTIISLFDTRIRSYMTLLNKIIDSTVVIIELANLNEIKSDNSQLIKDDEREALVPLMTRLYYSKYFALSAEGAKMKTKHKINLINYFIQLKQEEFDDYMKIMLSPVNSICLENLCDFDMRTYKKLLEIIKVNLKQITKLFSDKIEDITKMILRIFIFLKRLCDNIKTNKEKAISEITKCIESDEYIAKTKYAKYFTEEEMKVFLSFFSKNVKEIKKETFRIFAMIYDKFYTRTKMVSETSREICEEYKLNLTKSVCKINSMFKFFISLSSHAKLHFIFSENPILISSIMGILTNEKTEKKFISNVLEFVENLLSVYDTFEVNADSDKMIEEDIAIDDEAIEKNMKDIVVNNQSVFINSIAKFIKIFNITSSHLFAYRVIDILKKLFAIDASKETKDANKEILNFVISILLTDKLITQNKEKLNAILTLCLILLENGISFNEEDNVNVLLRKFIKLLNNISYASSRVYFANILAHFAFLYDDKAQYANVIEIFISLNKENQKRNLANELDTDFIYKVLENVDVEKNIKFCEFIIYQLFFLSINEDFALANLAKNKILQIAKFISTKNTFSQFKDVFDSICDFVSNKFEFAKISFEFLSEVNSVHESEIAFKDLFEIKVDDLDFFTAILNFKYEMRISALIELKAKMEKNEITFNSLFFIIKPIIKKFLDYKNYAIQMTNNKRAFIIRRSSEVQVRIVNAAIDIIPLLIDSMIKENNEDALCDLILYIHRNLNNLTKQKAKRNQDTFANQYSIDVFKMTTKALTTYLNHIICSKYTEIDFNTKFNQFSNNALTTATSTSDTQSSQSIRFMFSQILSQIASSYQYADLPSQSQLYSILSTNIFPSLTLLLYDESKRNNKSYHIRNYIISPLLSLIKILDPLRIRSSLVQLIIELTNQIANIDPNARASAREGISELMSSIGEFTSLLFAENLVHSLHSGYQRHVLSYTLNFIITKVSSKEIIEKLVPIVMPAMFDELFGDVSEEKEVDYLVNKYKEAKGVSAYMSFEYMCSRIEIANVVTDIIVPMKKYLTIRVSESNIVQRCNEVINAIIKGVKNNNTLNIDDLLEYAYVMIKMGIEANIKNAKSVRKMKNIMIKGNDIYTVDIAKTYSIDIANEFIKEKNDIIYSCIFACFGLDLVITAIKKFIGKGAKNNDNAEKIKNSPKLNDVVSNVVICLKMSNNTSLLSKATKILISLFDSKLPIIKKNLQKITNSLFKCVLTLNVNDTSAVQSVLSGISEIISRYKFIEISQERIKNLLLFLRININIAEIKPYVLSVIYAMIKRKILHPDIYDLIRFLCEVYVVSNENNTKNVCARIFAEFLNEYPMEKKAKKKFLEFFFANIESKTRICVINSIRMLGTFAESNFGEFNDLFDFIAMKMFANYANCNDSDVKEEIEKFFEKLVLSNKEDKFEIYYKKAVSILDNKNESNISMVTFAICVLNILLNHQFSFISKNANNIQQIIYDNILTEKEQYEEEISKAENEISNEGTVNMNIISGKWKTLYLLLYLLEKVRKFTTQPLSQSQIQIIAEISSHPKSFIKSITLRLLSQISPFPKFSPINLLTQIRNIILNTSFDSNIFRYANDVLLLIAKSKGNLNSLCSALQGVTNDCKKWISSKETGVVILNRVFTTFEMLVDDLDVSLKEIAKPIVELCYRVSNNSLADQEVKNTAERLIEKVGEKVGKDDVGNIYKSVVKEVNLLRQKRKMEQVEKFKQKQQGMRVSREKERKKKSILDEDDDEE